MDFHDQKGVKVLLKDFERTENSFLSGPAKMGRSRDEGGSPHKKRHSLAFGAFALIIISSESERLQF